MPERVDEFLDLLEEEELQVSSHMVEGMKGIVKLLDEKGGEWDVGTTVEEFLDESKVAKGFVSVEMKQFLKLKQVKLNSE